MEIVFSLSRVHPVGLIIMTLAVILALAARPLSARIPKAGENAVRLAALLLCCVGALIAIMGL